MCAVKTKKKVLEVWVDFSLSSKLNFLKVFFDTDLPKKIPTHPWSESDELEHALKGEAHGEGEVHVGQQVPQHERSSVKLDTGDLDKTRM